MKRLQLLTGDMAETARLNIVHLRRTAPGHQYPSIADFRHCIGKFEARC